MKTAVSLPDTLFSKAEETARRLKVFRSHLYATAIAEFIERHEDATVTERLNEYYSRHSSALDPAVHRAQVDSIDKDSWW